MDLKRKLSGNAITLLAIGTTKDDLIGRGCFGIIRGFA